VPFIENARRLVYANSLMLLQLPLPRSEYHADCHGPNSKIVFNVTMKEGLWADTSVHYEANAQSLEIKPRMETLVGGPSCVSAHPTQASFQSGVHL